jgi:hypothetical protein
MPYGRGETEWNSLIEEGLRFLVERARLGKVTSYTEMNVSLARRTGVRPFDFDQDGERRALGALLESISELKRPASGVMLSALVNYLGENDAGPGFYVYAQRIGLLRKGATADERLAFWAGQVGAVHKHYAAGVVS